MVQHGKEICKVPEDWAVANGAVLFGGRLTEGRRLNVVSGEVWADRWPMDLRWTVDGSCFSSSFQIWAASFCIGFFSFFL
jgi:hypothetical protein